MNVAIIISNWPYIKNMNNKKEIFILTKSICIAVLLELGMVSYSQTVDPPYEVAGWYGFRDAAITYTFDDGCSNQFTKAIPMLNEFGFGGTFFTVTNWTSNWTALQNAASQGHEVASHTVSHPDLSTLDNSQQNTELENSADIVYLHIEGMQGMTIAYPFCVPGNDSITALFYFAARGCQGFIESSTPADFLNISSIICGNQGAVNSVTAFQQKADAASNSSGWCVYLIHGIDGDGGYSPLSSDTLRRSLEYLDSNTETFWVGTFGNVVRYIRERNCLAVHETGQIEDTIRVEVADTLDKAVYDQPVTIRRPLPQEWEYAVGLQNEMEINTTIVEVNSENYIQFDAVPDDGEILLIKSEVPIEGLRDAVNNIQNHLKVWVDQQNLFFMLPPTSSPIREIGLYNIMGISFAKNHYLNVSANYGSIHLERETMTPGLYIVTVSDGNKMWTGKVQIPHQF